MVMIGGCSCDEIGKWQSLCHDMWVGSVVMISGRA